MALHIHDRRVRTKYEKRKRTLLKKLWEFFTFCNVEFHILMVNGTEATVVTAGNYHLPAESILVGVHLTVVSNDTNIVIGKCSRYRKTHHRGSRADLRPDDRHTAQTSRQLRT